MSRDTLDFLYIRERNQEWQIAQSSVGGNSQTRQSENK